eukprot:5006094-Prymnesium_polylepis.1
MLEGGVRRPILSATAWAKLAIARADWRSALVRMPKHSCHLCERTLRMQVVPLSPVVQTWFMGRVAYRPQDKGWVRYAYTSMLTLAYTSSAGDHIIGRTHGLHHWCGVNVIAVRLARQATRREHTTHR